MLGNTAGVIFHLGWSDISSQQQCQPLQIQCMGMRWVKDCMPGTMQSGYQKLCFPVVIDHFWSRRISPGLCFIGFQCFQDNSSFETYMHMYKDKLLHVLLKKHLTYNVHVYSVGYVVCLIPIA